MKEINTKVTDESYIFLKAIADNSNVTIYRMMQVVLESFIKYFSKDTVITESINKLLLGFADFRLAKDSFLFCNSLEGKRSINSCIALIQEENKQQPRCILIHKGKDNTLLQNYNGDSILNAFLCAFEPELISYLYTIKKENGLLSIMDALKFAVIEQMAPLRYDITADIESLFNDNMRDESGNVIDYEKIANYKRKMHYTVDTKRYYPLANNTPLENNDNDE